MKNHFTFKSLFSLLALLFVASGIYAQDCSSADDCLTKGRNNNFTDSSIEQLTQGIKFAKKEKVNAAMLYFERGKKHYNKYTPTKDTESDFLEAIKLDPEYFWAYSWLGAFYQVKMNDYEKANKWFNSVVEKFPENPRSYYDRAHNHRYHNHMDLAFPDFEAAYNLLTLLMDGAEDVDSSTKGDICRWYAIAYMKKNGLYVYDAKALEILVAGATMAPESPILLGELALAYYDNDQLQKASEVGYKAVSLDKDTYNSKNVGGNLIKGLDMYNQKSLFSAASHCGYADGNLANPHPLVYYYHAITLWEYNLSMFDTNPNLWSGSLSKLKNRLELTIKYGQGTKYQYLADAAKKNLEQLNK